MYKEDHTQPWSQYLEIPRISRSPMKLDRILKRRMKAFLKARQKQTVEAVSS